ncbi:MAG: IS21 family transposase [Candidatus Dormibacteria bacterium]
MFSPEEAVEASALRKQGWTISAIARHLDRDRKTIRVALTDNRAQRRRSRAGPDLFAAFEPYVGARLRDDPHVWATALYDEVRRLGFILSYQRFTHEIRRRRLRPHCEPCAGVRGRDTIEIEHPPGEEIQWDWLELPSPWGEGDVHLLMGTLSHSGKTRGVFAESEDQPHLIQAIDAVLRQLGGTARRWRFDRMGTVVTIGTARVLATFAAVAKHYGVGVDICPPRRGNRKGGVEKANHFATQRWWRTAPVSDLEQATRAFEEFQSTIGDARERHGTTVGQAVLTERLLPLPALPYPAGMEVTRIVNSHALVEFRGNSYSVPPGLAGHELTLRHRLGSEDLGMFSMIAGIRLAQHRLARPGAGQTIRLPEHRAALETAVLGAFSTARPCRRKENRPPGPEARAAAAVLAAATDDEVVVDLSRYAELAEVAM